MPNLPGRGCCVQRKGCKSIFTIWKQWPVVWSCCHRNALSTTLLVTHWVNSPLISGMGWCGAAWDSQNSFWCIRQAVDLSNPRTRLEPWGFQLQPFFQGLCFSTVNASWRTGRYICAWFYFSYGIVLLVALRAKNGLILQSKYLAFTSVISEDTWGSSHFCGAPHFSSKK